jgi:hypothetical protein
MFEQAISNFSGGEVSVEVQGRWDSEVYKNALKRCENFIAMTQGALVYRGATTYQHPTRLQKTARIEKFVFSDDQVYTLEFTDAKLRIYSDDSITLNPTTKNITAASKAAACQVTAVGHGLATGDEIYITGVTGMTELNGRFFRVVKVDNDKVTLKDLFGVDINSTGFTTYSASGTLAPIYELTSPYPEAVLDEFQFDQEANDATFVHDAYAPYRLTRTSATSWAIATFARTADPFTGAGKYPRTCCYFEGCLYYGGSVDNPNRWWRSRGPEDTGATRYDDFTTGADADHAIISTLSSIQKQTAFIHWMVPLNSFIAIGTEAGIIGLDGGGDAAITPTNYRTRPIDPVGVHGASPVTDGQTVFYIQKGSRIVRSFEYDLLADKYKSFDRSFLAPHLTVGGVKKLVLQRWKLNLLWGVCDDGRLISLTIKPKEDVTGWHRYSFGGEGEIVDAVVTPQVEGYDRLRLVVKRTINSTTTRYLEYLNDPWEGLDRHDYYTGDQEADETAYLDELYEAQRECQYLDSSLGWDGSDRGSITVTPGATSGESVTFTASSGVFAAGDVGKRITKKYQDRVGGGQARIIGYTSSTVVTCLIETDFDSTDAIPAGDWTLTGKTIGGLWHLEGETLQVIADGRRHPDVTVAVGQVTLNRQAGRIIFGYKYRGIAIPLNLVVVGATQNSISFGKNISTVAIMMSNTIGVRYGTSLYELQEIYPSSEGQLTDRPPVPFTGVLPLPVEDTWTEDKNIVYVQDNPYPCMLNGMNITIDVGEK